MVRRWRSQPKAGVDEAVAATPGRPLRLEEGHGYPSGGASPEPARGALVCVECGVLLTLAYQPSAGRGARQRTSGCVGDPGRALRCAGKPATQHATHARALP